MATYEMLKQQVRQELTAEKKKKNATTYAQLKQMARQELERDGAVKKVSTYEALKQQARQELFDADVRKVDTAYIQDFTTAATDFLRSAGEDSKNVTWDNAATSYNAIQEKWKTYDRQQQVITAWMEENRETLDPAAYRQMQDFIGAFNTDASTVLGWYKDATDHYAQWDTQEAYDKAVRESGYYQKYSVMPDAELADAIMALPEGEEKDWADAYRLYHYDTEAAQKEIEEIEAYYEENHDKMMLMETWYNTYLMNPEGSDPVMRTINQAKYKALTGTYGTLAQIEDLLQDKKQYLKLAEDAQELAGFEAVGNARAENYDPEFLENAGYASTAYDGSSWTSSFSGELGLGYGDLTYEYINGKDTGMREQIMNGVVADNALKGNVGIKTLLSAADRLTGGNVEALHTAANTYGAGQDYTIYDYMDDSEIAVYNYHYAKKGKQSADRYLELLRQRLEQRKAGDIFEGIKDKTGLELLYGASAGLDQFDAGIRNLGNLITGNDAHTPVSAIQIAAGAAREDLADVGPNLPEWLGGGSVGQVGYDLINSTANMAPSVLVSTAVGIVNPVAGAAVGSALMGASTAGNAYQQKINLGYSAEEARTYSLAVGASEAVLQYALGGISKLGNSVLSSTVLKNLDAVDNVLARFARSAGGKLALNMASESIEEGIQAILEPYIWHAVSGEEFTVEMQDVLYSALLGGLSGGVFEGAGQISSAFDLQAQQALTQSLIEQGIDQGQAAAFATAVADAISNSELTEEQIALLEEMATDTRIQQTVEAVATPAQPVKPAPEVMTDMDLFRYAENILQGDLSRSDKSVLKSAQSSREELAALKRQQNALQEALLNTTAQSNKAEIMNISSWQKRLEAQIAKIEAGLRAAAEKDSYTKLTQKLRDKLKSLENTPEFDKIFLEKSEKTDTITVDSENFEIKSYEAAFEGMEILSDGSHLENGKLKPNVVYRCGENGYLYQTDSQGRVIKVVTDNLRGKQHAGRLVHNQKTPGKQAGDHAGHLVADRFGGSPDLDNMVSQAKDVNLSEYKKIENEWAAAIQKGQHVQVEIQIVYGEGSRPTGFAVSYNIDGKAKTRTISNSNKG